MPIPKRLLPKELPFLNFDIPTPLKKKNRNNNPLAFPAHDLHIVEQRW